MDRGVKFEDWQFDDLSREYHLKAEEAAVERSSTQDDQAEADRIATRTENCNQTNSQRVGGAPASN